MSQLFEVSGVSLDNTIFVLYGADAPGVSQETIDAPVGSVYYDTTGKTWKKFIAGSGTVNWTLETGDVNAGILSVTNVTANVVTILDSLDSATVETAVWSVSLSSHATPANKEVLVITGSHNGVVAKFSIYSKLKFGAAIPALSYDVQLLAGKLQLVASAGVALDIECYRLTAVSKGTVTLLGGGGGGTGDVTSAQLAAEASARVAGDAANAASNAATAAALAAEVTARTAGDATLTTALSAKADITAVATQFASVATSLSAKANTSSLAAVATTGSYTDLSNTPPIPIVPTLVSAFTNDVPYLVAGDISGKASSATTLAGYGITNAYTKAEVDAALAGVSGGGSGATLAVVATTGSYTDLINKPVASTYTGSFVFSDLTSGLITVMHNLGEKVVLVQVYDNADLMVIPNEVRLIDINSLEINLSSFGVITGTWHIKIVKTGGAAPPSTETIVFNALGLVTPSEGTSRWYPFSNSAIEQLYFTMGTPSTVDDTVCELKVNGTTVTTITCAQGDYKSEVKNITSTVTPDDYVTFDIVSGTSGANLYMVLKYLPS